MKLIDYLDRAGERRLERWRIQPPRPRDTRMVVGTLFFLGYYALVWALLHTVVPTPNSALVRDAMLVLGPVIGAIGQALFRTDVKDEIVAGNTGSAFNAVREQARATSAAIAAPGPTDGGAGKAADDVADAAQERADEIKGQGTPPVRGAADLDSPMEP